MGQQSKDDERRVFPRIELSQGELKAEVGADGFRPTAAFVQNISRGGVKLRLEERALDGVNVDDCVVRFLDEDNRVSPMTMKGWIRRAGLSRREFFVCIEFDEPLDVLNLLSTTTSV